MRGICVWHLGMAQHRMQALKALLDTLNEECFDEADRMACQEQLKREAQGDERMSEELKALSIYVPMRQRLLDALDTKYNLTELFPELMRMLVEKDVELQALYQQELHKHRLKLHS